MDWLQVFILALVQGITEFLPISSSAHLILVPLLTAWEDHGLEIDVAAHLGSLLAVILYFRKDIAQILLAGLASMRDRKLHNHDSQLFWYLLFASIPVLLFGFLLRDVISTTLRDPLVIATSSIGFGLLLWAADIFGKRERNFSTITMKDTLLIGFAQCLALIPGTSRSGITLTAALFIGLQRQAAARFSFLLAVPVILAAASYEALTLLQTGSTINLIGFVVTAALSAVCAFIAIRLFLRFLDQLGMLPFVIYRILLGAVLFVLYL